MFIALSKELTMLNTTSLVIKTSRSVGLSCSLFSVLIATPGKKQADILAHSPVWGLA